MNEDAFMRPVPGVSNDRRDEWVGPDGAATEVELPEPEFEREAHRAEEPQEATESTDSTESTDFGAVEASGDTAFTDAPTDSPGVEDVTAEDEPEVEEVPVEALFEDAAEEALTLAATPLDTPAEEAADDRISATSLIDLRDDAAHEATDEATTAGADGAADGTDLAGATSADLHVPEADIAVTPDPFDPAAPPEPSEDDTVREERLTRIFESTVVDADGQKVGRVGHVYLNDATQEPNWITVKVGLLGTKERLVPLHDAELDGHRLVLPYTKDHVLAAPVMQADQNLSPADEDILYAHFNVDPEAVPAEGVAEAQTDASEQATEGLTPIPDEATSEPEATTPFERPLDDIAVEADRAFKDAPGESFEESELGTERVHDNARGFTAEAEAPALAADADADADAQEIVDGQADAEGRDDVDAPEDAAEHR